MNNGKKGEKNKMEQLLEKNELETLKTTLPQLVKNNLVAVDYTQEVIIVNSESELKKAKEIVKEISEKSKDFKNYISPIKKIFDDTHAIVTTFEKEKLAIGAKLKDDQEKEISDYNKRVFECQQKKENYLKDFASVISKMEQNFAQAKLNFETELNKLFAEKELERIQSLQVPIAQKIDAIEDARKEIEKTVDNIIIIPQVEIPIEKVTLKKDLKKEIKTFYVKDEQAAIDFILKEFFIAMTKENSQKAAFWKGLLSISLSKKSINEALKDEEFQTLGFLGYTSEFK